MITATQKKAIVDFADGHLSQNDKYHKLQHAQETARVALEFAVAENASLDICWVSAILHDISKRKPGDHAVTGAEESKKFLLSIGLPKQFANAVYDTIYYHNKDFDDGSIERQILWDADKLQVMTPDGFRRRLLAGWIDQVGRKKGIGKAVKEYHFYYVRFHTANGKKEIAKHRKYMDDYLKKLRTEE
ncbi:MAG: HD domain-containing protein [Candidatus Micrarchaeota archaeon]